MTTTRTATICPHCGLRHSHASTVRDEDVAPVPGDASMCVSCGRWAVFDEHMQLRRPTYDEMNELGRHYDLKQFHLAWVMATKMKGRPA